MKIGKVISVILVIVFLFPALSIVFTPLKAYAYSRQDIPEGNKQNNCGEGIFLDSIPNIIIEEIECGQGNKLSVTIKNMGMRQYAGVLSEDWEAVAEVYFDGKKMGTFDISVATATENGGIDYPYGSATYLLKWDITPPVSVMVTIHATTIPQEGEGEHKARETISRQVQFEPPTTTSTGGTRYLLPLLLGLIGIIIVVWAGYQKYSSCLKKG